MTFPVQLADLNLLQASKQGEPIYRALGFEEFTRYPWYLSLPRAAS